jgi:hypothetical protein
VLHPILWLFGTSYPDPRALAVVVHLYVWLEGRLLVSKDCCRAGTSQKGHMQLLGGRKGVDSIGGAFKVEVIVV